MSSSKNNIPYLIIGFNRPSKLREAILNVQQFSDNIFISIDGPRNIEEKKKVTACIEIANEFVKPSRLKFNEFNLGCKNAVEGGLDWFFSNNDFGAIIEDDIRIGKAFSDSVIELANKPRPSEVGSFCGYNHFPVENRYDYFASHFTGVWGWATWSEIWNKGKKNTSFLREKVQNADDSIFLFDNERTFWLKKLDEIDMGKKDSWAYPWSISLILNQLYTLRPYQTYTENAGFDSEATHTSNPNRRVQENTIGTTRIESDIREAEFDIKMDRIFYERQLNAKFYFKILRRLGFKV